MKILLDIRSGSNAASKLPVMEGKPLRFGRTDKADHSFPDDKQMSSLHFAVELTEKGCRLLDLNSSNGTFLNGARVKEAILANGDQIRAGATVFVIRMIRDDTPAVTSQSAPAEPYAKTAEPPRASFAAPPPSPSRQPSPNLPSFSDRPAPAPLKPGELPSFPVAAPRVVFADAPPAAPLPPPAPKLPRLQDLLAKDLQPLYALLDASREPS